MSHKTAKAERQSAREAEKSKGWRIDVRPYEVKVPDVDEETGKINTKAGKVVMVKDEFDVKGSLADILFNRELQLKPSDAFDAHELALKIRSAKDYVIFDSKEMSKIRNAYDALKGVTENMIEFCRRIRDAEEIELKAAE